MTVYCNARLALHEHHSHVHRARLTHPRFSRPEVGDEDEEWEENMPWEPAGHGEIATSSVSSCAAFWRTFARSSVVMNWIEDGYRLL